MNELKIQNARIDRTFLGVEDHGITTAVLNLDLGGTSQGFGTYNLGTSDEPSELLGLFVRRVLQIVGVTSWEELRGKYIRIEGSFNQITRIGHIIEDKWFDPKAEFERLQRKNAKAGKKK